MSTGYRHSVCPCMAAARCHLIMGAKQRVPHTVNPPSHDPLQAPCYHPNLDPAEPPPHASSRHARSPAPPHDLQASNQPEEP